MSRARVLCNPSVTAASGEMEGLGMILAEAQAVGTPVVSFSHAAIPEVVDHGHTGLLCPEANVTTLSRIQQTSTTKNAKFVDFITLMEGHSLCSQNRFYRLLKPVEIE